MRACVNSWQADSIARFESANNRIQAHSHNTSNEEAGGNVWLHLQRSNAQNFAGWPSCFTDHLDQLKWAILHHRVQILLRLHVQILPAAYFAHISSSCLYSLTAYSYPVPIAHNAPSLKRHPSFRTPTHMEECQTGGHEPVLDGQLTSCRGYVWPVRGGYPSRISTWLDPMKSCLERSVTWPAVLTVPPLFFYSAVSMCVCCCCCRLRLHSCSLRVVKLCQRTWFVTSRQFDDARLLLALGVGSVKFDL